ncbi:PadR family transcriptional regulator [Nocardia otitidiscaviarum]|uniref:PadR family transcriptional regulator n=1 Tax=Nocardia otitidiscaviarum TaxID=1823 RepID=UPI002454A417|nr:PadR family transcriptional regulator [Nocardia otitidiscaviarum]
MSDATSAVRSPLNLVVLALLFEAPMHPYRMQRLITERGKDKVVNIGSRNSIAQTVARLERAGLIEVRGAERDGGYPQRTIYALTDAGRTELLESLHRLLATPAREFPLFPAALSLMAITTVEATTRLLRLRREELARRVAQESETMAAAAERLPRVLLIEDDYRVALLHAEIAWLDRTLRDLGNGDLSWDTGQLVRQSRETR